MKLEWQKIKNNLSIRTEGCTFFPDGYFGYNWSEAICEPHDKAYAESSCKFKADLIMFLQMLRHGTQCLFIGLFLLITSLPVYLVISTFGWLRYNRKNKDGNT